MIEGPHHHRRVRMAVTTFAVRPNAIGNSMEEGRETVGFFVFDHPGGDVGDQCDLDLAAKVVDRQGLERPGDAEAGVVDEPVETTPGRFGDPFDRGRDLVGLGDVAMEAALALAAQPDTRVVVSYRGDGFRRGKARNVEEMRRAVAAGRRRGTEPPHSRAELRPADLASGRRLQVLTTDGRRPVTRNLEPGPAASLPPNTPAPYAIPPGDRRRFTTRRGSIELTARADMAVQEGTVFIPFAYVEAAANILTNPQLDPYGKIPEFKFCAVRAEKVELRTAAE